MGQSRDTTGNIRHKMQNEVKQNIKAQHRKHKIMSNTDPSINCNKH
jgi:hypothetical protein